MGDEQEKKRAKLLRVPATTETGVWMDEWMHEWLEHNDPGNINPVKS